MKKSNLPTKVCVKCDRPFTWRKKWKNVWNEVKYCSERCKREKNTYFRSSLIQLKVVYLVNIYNFYTHFFAFYLKLKIICD